MKVKYFEYNSDQNGEKYIEVSEEKFIKDVIITEGRFYISFGNSVLECSESEYKEEAKRKRHDTFRISVMVFIRRLRNLTKTTVISFSMKISLNVLRIKFCFRMFFHIC